MCFRRGEDPRKAGSCFRAEALDSEKFPRTEGRESLSGTGSLKRGEGTTCSRAKDLGSREPGWKEGLPRKHVYMPETVYITIAVAIAKRSHLFSCRTQKLSSSTPKVLGWQRPGRLGSRRIPLPEGSSFRETRKGISFRKFSAGFGQI